MAVKFQHRILKRVRILLLRCQGSAIYFSAQTRGVGVCYWKSICTFLGNHLLWSFAVAFFLFCFFLLLSMSSGDTDYQRLSSVSGRAPRGPLSLFCAGTQSQCRGWGLFQVLSSFPTSNCMHRFKKKQAMKACWLRRQHCEVNIFHGAERMVEK